MKLKFLTSNAGKFAEAKAIFPILEQVELDLHEIQSLDAEVVIASKLEEASKQIDGELIVDDTGLYLDGMNGLPGVMTKWFLESIGEEGVTRLADQFGAVAKIITTIGYTNGGDYKFFKGEMLGRVVEPRGDRGFGFDKIFEVESLGKTLGEITLEEKNEISTRADALNQLKLFLENN